MAPAAPARRTRLTRGQLWTLTVSCVGVSVVVAAMAALYTALPDIAVAVHASQTQLTWIVDGYTLALACLVLPAGAIGDRFGRRHTLVAGLVVFAFASAMPLIWRDPNLIIASRTLAGVGAAFVMPSTLSIVTSTFPKEQRSHAIGIWAGITGAGGVMGLFGSGLLLERWSWVSVFVALTAAGTALVALAFTLPESREEQRPRLDPLGALTAALCISGFVFAIIETSERGWASPVVITPLVIGTVAGALFITVEWRSPAPMLDLRYFARRGFGSGALSLTIQFVVTFGLFLIVVQYLQLVLGFGPVKTALALAPVAAPLVLLSTVMPWLADKLGLRTTTTLGLVTIGAGMWWLSTLHAGSSYLASVLPMVTVSLGLSFCAAPATAAIMQDTPAEKHGVAAAVNDVSREMGAAIGIAVAGSVLASSYSQHIHPALSYLPAAARRPVADSLAAALQVADRAGPVGRPLADFAKSAFMHGLTHASLVLAVISLVGAGLIALWAPGRRRVVSLSKATSRRVRVLRQMRLPLAAATLRRLFMRGSHPPTPS